MNQYKIKDSLNVKSLLFPLYIKLYFMNFLTR